MFRVRQFGILALATSITLVCATFSQAYVLTNNCALTAFNFGSDLKMLIKSDTKLTAQLNGISSQLAYSHLGDTLNVSKENQNYITRASVFNAMLVSRWNNGLNVDEAIKLTGIELGKGSVVGALVAPLAGAFDVAMLKQDQSSAMAALSVLSVINPRMAHAFCGAFHIEMLDFTRSREQFPKNGRLLSPLEKDIVTFAMLASHIEPSTSPSSTPSSIKDAYFGDHSKGAAAFGEGPSSNCVNKCIGEAYYKGASAAAVDFFAGVTQKVLDGMEENKPPLYSIKEKAIESAQKNHEIFDEVLDECEKEKCGFKNDTKPTKPPDTTVVTPTPVTSETDTVHSQDGEPTATEPKPVQPKPSSADATANAASSGGEHRGNHLSPDDPRCNGDIDDIPEACVSDVKSENSSFWHNALGACSRETCDSANPVAAPDTSDALNSTPSDVRAIAKNLNLLLRDHPIESLQLTGEEAEKVRNLLSSKHFSDYLDSSARLFLFRSLPRQIGGN